MFELIDSIVQEIGEEHVVQLVTDSVTTLVKVGELLVKKKTKLFGHLVQHILLIWC